MSARILCLTLLIVACSGARGDPQSKSFSHWQVSGPIVEATFSIATSELLRLTGPQGSLVLRRLWQEEAGHSVRLATGSDCTQKPPRALPTSTDRLRVALTWECSSAPEHMDITINTLFDQVASHVHFANFKLPGPVREERLFSAAHRQARLAWGDSAHTAERSGAAIVSTYTRLGFEHILIGLDHIAFLLGLLLLGGSWRSLLWIITGFTLGHSITLSASALGLIQPDIALVEALIGLSIALVAIENVAVTNGSHRQAAWTSAAALLALAGYGMVTPAQSPTTMLSGLALLSWCYLMLSDSPRRARQLRPAMSTGFGLIHGFGFASVLLEVGLPESARPLALLGFNVGVELGQILIVAGLVALATGLTMLFPMPRRNTTDLLSAALCGLGTYWFIARLA